MSEPARNHDSDAGGRMVHAAAAAKKKGLDGLGKAVTGVGLLLVLAGLYAAAALFLFGDGAPKCEGRAMHPGDRCVQMPSGRSSTYKEMADAHNRMRPVWESMIGAGVAGVAMLVIAARRER